MTFGTMNDPRFLLKQKKGRMLNYGLPHPIPADLFKANGVASKKAQAI
jgi:hypothetical protein